MKHLWVCFVTLLQELVINRLGPQLYILYFSIIWQWHSKRSVDDKMEFRCFDHLCWTSEEDPSSYSYSGSPYYLPWCLEDLSMVFSEENIAILCGNETYPVVQRYYAPDQSYLESDQTFNLTINDFSEECVSRIKQRSSGKCINS